MTRLKMQKNRENGRSKGFTLIEFAVSMSIFTIVMAAVFTLFRKNDPLFSQQQTMVGMNLALQGAVTQMELDGVNAGTGYYPGTNIPNWPIGITIQNSVPVTGSCGDNATFTYAATCFDTLNFITVDPNTAPQHLGALNGTISTTASPMVLYTPGLTAGQLTTLAGLYHSGDELMLLAVDGSLMTTVKLTANGTVSGGAVSLAFTATNADGTNTVANDYLGITSSTDSASNNGHTQLGTVFGNSDWILRLQPITYSVNTANTADPQLMRTQGGVSTLVADQVIGFRIGAALYNDTHNTDSITSNLPANCSSTSDTSTSTGGYGTYNYNACSYGASAGGTYDFSIIRSIRVSIIGRTNPSANNSAITFKNSFDSGPYQIQGLAIVINPRNLSMAD
jgi:prepilin-type N-terminal cleavage/methylation domain-containing protein